MTYGPQQRWTPGQQQPMGPYGRPMAARRPQSPIPLVIGLVGLLGFVYLTYSVLIVILAENGAGLTTSRVAHRTAMIAGFQPLPLVLLVGLIAILFLVGGILVLGRKPAGRIVAAIAAVGTIPFMVKQLVQFPGGYISVLAYVFTAIAVAALVLCVLPATGQALHRQDALQPPYPQAPYPPQFAQQQPFQPGFPPQQAPGGYQQPPGGRPN